jgi:WD40 repeat protein
MLAVLAQAYTDGRVSVWSVHPLEEVFTEDTPAPIGKHRWRRIAISSDSTRLAIANWRGEIDIWETGSWKRRATLHIESESDLLAIALSSSTECVVASRGSAAAVTVWNVDERRLTADYRIEMAANRFDTAAVLPDHRLLVASGFDRTFVWKFGKAGPIASVPRGIAGRGLAVSPDGSALLWRTRGGM